MYQEKFLHANEAYLEEPDQSTGPWQYKAQYVMILARS